MFIIVPLRVDCGGFENEHRTFIKSVGDIEDKRYRKISMKCVIGDIV